MRGKTHHPYSMAVTKFPTTPADPASIVPGAARYMLQGHPNYPERLRLRLQYHNPPAPNPLWVCGNLDLFTRPMVAVIGRRHCSDRGERLAADSAGILARAGVCVVSGAAKGIDKAAHLAALVAGGSTVLVVAEGLDRVHLSGWVADELTPENYLAISEQPPDEPWSAKHAMDRNRITVGLAGVVLVIEAGTDGGTWAAANTALRLGLPVFVVAWGEGAPASAAGNALLLRRGARPVGKSRVTGRANLDAVIEVAKGVQTT